MNMLEVLSIIKTNCEQYNPTYHNYSDGMYWARPISWRGMCLAFTWEDGRVGYSSPGWIKVPAFNGRGNAFLPAHEIFEEWEIVSPIQVNSGE